MATDELPLTYLLMGMPKSGKSYQSVTGPPPRLAIDWEGRTRFTPAGIKATYWDGESDPMQLPKSESRTFILEQPTLDTFATARQWLRSGKHPFKSVSFDSIMEYKYQIEKTRYEGILELEPKEKGKVNKELEDGIRDIRDLTTKPGPVKCAIFITGAYLDSWNGSLRSVPLGRVGDLVPFWMSIVGYIEKETRKDSKNVRYLTHITQRLKNDLDEVGDGTNRIARQLGSPVVDLTVQQLFDALQDQKEEESVA